MKKMNIFFSSLWRAVLIGLVVAIVFFGLVGIQVMGESDDMIKTFYFVGAILGGIVSIVTMPILYHFHRKDGGPIELI